MDAFVLISLIFSIILANFCAESQYPQTKPLGKNIKIVNYIKDDLTCTVNLSECSVYSDVSLPEQGPKGDLGEAGPPGISGPCDCNPIDNGKGDTANRPSKTTCKYSVTGSKPQWIGPNELESFRVNCDKENLTCIAQENFQVPVSISVMKGSKQNKFMQWNKMAEKSLMEMSGIRPSQITWLHGLVNSVRQTVRIRGLDITPQNEDSLGAMVNFLTWNDARIGSVPKSTPFYYKFELPQTCVEKSPPEACEYVDIKMKTNIVTRLPVTDIIFDFSVMKIEKDLNISVEIVELCFD